MAAYHGKDGAVYISTNQVGEVTAYSYNESGEELEVVAMGDTAKRFLTGLVDASGQFTVNYDDADTQQEALDIGDDVELHLYPRGQGATKPEFTSVGNDAGGTVKITAIEMSQDTGSAVQRTYTFRNNLLRATQV
jgi:hypothetical protein